MRDEERVRARACVVVIVVTHLAVCLRASVAWMHRMTSLGHVLFSTQVLEHAHICVYKVECGDVDPLNLCKNYFRSEILTVIFLSIDSCSGLFF